MWFESNNELLWFYSKKEWSDSKVVKWKKFVNNDLNQVWMCDLS